MKPFTMIRNIWRLDLSVNKNTKLNLIKAWMSTIDKVSNIICSHTSDELNCSNHSILQAYHLGRYEPSFNATEELHAGQWCSGRLLCQRSVVRIQSSKILFTTHELYYKMCWKDNNREKRGCEWPTVNSFGGLFIQKL